MKGLDFILRLRPITYQFDVKGFDAFLQSKDYSLNANESKDIMEASYKEASSIRRTGFIAQEVEKAADATGYNFSGIVKPKTEKEHYSLSYESFVVPLVKAMQEQQQMISALDKKLATQQQQIDKLKKLIAHPRK